MLVGPTPAALKALDRAGLKPEDIDLWELNEAFASVVLKFQKDLNIPGEKLNVNGGAIAMGPPAGATRRHDHRHHGRRARASRRQACADHAVHRRRHGRGHHHRARLERRNLPRKLGEAKTMAENTIQWDKDADGIVTLTLDDPTGGASVMNEHYRNPCAGRRAPYRREKDSVTGVVITSAKEDLLRRR